MITESGIAAQALQSLGMDPPPNIAEDALTTLYTSVFGIKASETSRTTPTEKKAAVRTHARTHARSTQGSRYTHTHTYASTCIGRPG
jgi:hypothetical protein